MNEQLRLIGVSNAAYTIAENVGVNISVTATGAYIIKDGKFISQSLHSIDQLYGWLACYQEHAK